MILIIIPYFILTLLIYYIMSSFLYCLFSFFYIYWSSKYVFKKLSYILFICFFIFLFFTEVKKDVHNYYIYYKVVRHQYKWVNNKLFSKIYIYSKHSKLDPILVTALINAESKGRQYAISQSKARGYMQVMPVHYKKNPQMLYRTNLNLFLGCKYLKFCKIHSKGNLVETLRKYNQGHNAKRSTYTNWDYVKKILRHYNKMKLEFLFEKLNI